MPRRLTSSRNPRYLLAAIVSDNFDIGIGRSITVRIQEIETVLHRPFCFASLIFARAKAEAGPHLRLFPGPISSKKWNPGFNKTRIYKKKKFISFDIDEVIARNSKKENIEMEKKERIYSAVSMSFKTRFTFSG